MTQVSDNCPNCGGQGLSHIYFQADAPVHDVALIYTREEALSYPRGDIDLGFCTRCAFATNTAFEPSLLSYDPCCEESQAASATFNAFHERLAKQLIDRFDLHGKHVVEIGCGKGEFLALLCEMGGNRGTGFDPAYVPGRTRMPEDVNVKTENFTASHRLEHTDFVCCKMTLEHIHRPGDFLLALRQALADGDAGVFMQVPDARRVYEQRAFWDIYYEHCSYFTSMSLQRSFADAGFHVEEISAAYEGQYLTVFASTDKEIDIAFGSGSQEIEDLVLSFKNQVQTDIESWRSRLRAEHSAGGTTALWGGGSKAVAFLTATGLRSEVDAVVDINERKHGTFLPVTGHSVIAPEQLRSLRPSLVVIMNPVYEMEIVDRLSAMMLDPKVACLD